jgi:epoxyqueuosine reductase QueG
MKTITVCDKCLQASCWQGLFMCDKSQTAGTVKKTEEELSLLNLEHPSYWKSDEELSK